MRDLKKARNIGIAAHIDSGKTTISERILFYAGKIHKIVEIRSKGGDGPTMDSMDLEREKGITIQSAATYCRWNDHEINLIDTPGHIDFTIEVERALRSLDGAILALCGVAGVQSQTMTVERQMRRYNVPKIAFINKVDRSGANPDKVAAQLKDKLGQNPIMINVPIGLEDEFVGVVDVINRRAVYFEGDYGEKVRFDEVPEHLRTETEAKRNAAIETVADYDDEIAEKFLAEEEITAEELEKSIRALTISLLVTPVYIGSAKMNKGIQTLLDGVCKFLPAPDEVKNEALDRDKGEEPVELVCDSDKPFLGLAFKLEEGKYGQLTYVRIYQGTLSKGDVICNTANGKKIKTPRIVKMHASQMNDVSTAEAGEIVALFGVDCASGDTFANCDLNYSMSSMFVPEPVIELAVKPKDNAKQGNFSKALNRFTKEDPTFKVKYDEEMGETLIRGMGELHLDIYIERIKREYNCEVEVGRPKVSYRETITKRADFNYTLKKQTGGSGQFARVAGYVEPFEPTDGDKENEFVDKIVGGSIPREYIPACEKGFFEQFAEGINIEQPVVNARVVINDGQTHPVDSSEQAFKTASKLAMRNILPKCGAIILEPIMKLEVSVPEEFQGVAVGKINQRRGMIIDTVLNMGFVTVEAEVPLREMFGFSTDLRSITQGKGEFTMEFSKYSQVPTSIEEEIRKEYKESKEK